jgi:5S rRNA maturation endonuclease (ribonuclease M5)
MLTLSFSIQVKKRRIRDTFHFFWALFCNNKSPRVKTITLIAQNFKTKSVQILTDSDNQNVPGGDFLYILK